MVSTLQVLCAGNSPVTGEFPAQRPVTISLDVFFDLRLNKWLSKQRWGWEFETLTYHHDFDPDWNHETMSITITTESTVWQGSFCVCTQPIWDGVTMLRHLSLAGRLHRMISGVVSYKLARHFRTHGSWPLYMNKLFFITHRIRMSTPQACNMGNLTDNNADCFVAPKGQCWKSHKMATCFIQHSRILFHVMTSSNGNIFRVTGRCAGNSSVTGEFSSPAKAVTRNFGVFFDSLLNKRLSKQSWGWRFESPSRPLWRHCNDERKPLRLGFNWSLSLKQRWLSSVAVSDISSTSLQITSASTVCSI